jgi:small subunit ribosomal protein S17
MAKAMRKVRTGFVVGTKMDRTAVVDVRWRQRHRLYGKQVGRTSRFYVHDPNRQCQVGDLVRIEETRPISRTKRWRLLEIVQRHEVPEVLPIELEREELEIEASEAEAAVSSSPPSPEQGSGQARPSDLEEE